MKNRKPPKGPTKYLESYPRDIAYSKEPTEQGSSDESDFDKKELEWDKPRVDSVAEDILFTPGDIIEINFSAGSPESEKNIVRGKIVEMISDGLVPGIDEEVMGTSQDPAVRIQIYHKENEVWEPLNKFIGLKMSELDRTAQRLSI
jgi:hypothetical protein